MSGFIHSLWISKNAGEAMTSLDVALLEENKGIQGDRYYQQAGTFSDGRHKSDHEVTLISFEAIELFRTSYKIAFSLEIARRNIVTQGVDLNELIGKTVVIGFAHLKFIRLCEPCGYLAELTGLPQILQGLKGCGGIRASVIKTGEIKIGDSLAWL